MTIRTALLEARFLLRRPGALRRASRPLRQGGGARQRARVRRREAQGARRPRHQGRRLALPRRAERQGRQGRASRSQHAVLDLEIRLPGARAAGARRGRPLHPGRAPAVRALRGIPVAGPLPHAFRDRPGRGAPRLRAAAPARRAHGPGPARRAFRRRALHEGVFPRRQGGRRPHRDRLRRARGAPGEAPADARPHDRALPAPPRRQARIRRLRRRLQPHQPHGRGRVRARSGEPDPPVLARRPAQPRGPPGCEPARDALARAHRPDAAQRPRGEPPVHGRPDLAQRAGGGAAADERGRGARALHPRFRPHRRDDAVQHVPPLHGRRASPALDRRARRDRRPAGRARAPALEPHRALDPEPAGALRGAVPARHRQGPHRGPFDRRRRHRPQARARGSASIRPKPRPRPGSSSIIS